MSHDLHYRQGPHAPGLPLPRRGLAPLSVLLGGLAVGAMVAAIPSLGFEGSHWSGRAAYTTWRDGGGGMYVLGLLDVVVFVALGVLGVLLVRGRKIPPGVLLLLPLGAFVLTAAFAEGAMLSVTRAIYPITGEQANRILLEGTAESLALDRLGGFVAGAGAMLASLAAALSVASIDRKLVARAFETMRGSLPPPASKLPVIATIALGALWIVATSAVLLVRLFRGAESLLVVLPLFFVVPLAIAAASAASNAPILRAWHDAAEAKRHHGALLVALVASVAAMLLLEHAIEAAVTARTFSAVASDSVDPSQQARILLELARARAFWPFVTAANVTFPVLVFGSAALASVGKDVDQRARIPASPSAVLAVALAALTLLVAVGLGLTRKELVASAARTDPKAYFNGTTPPVVARGASFSPAMGGRRPIVVPGRRIDLTGACDGRGIHGETRGTIFASREVTAELLASRLAPENCREYELVVAQESKVAFERELGDLASLVAPSAGALRFTVGDARTAPVGLDVRTAGPSAITIDGKRVELPDASGNLAKAGRATRVTYTFSPDDTVQQMATAMAAVEDVYEGEFGYEPHATVRFSR